MNKYEVLYILDSAIEETAKDAIVEKFSALVTNSGGEVLEVNKWGVRKLAYPIDFKKDGYYVLMTFNADVDLPAELERQLRITDGVMRFLVTKKIQ